MIDFRSLMLLRILTDTHIAAKGGQLEWPELDTNQMIMANTLARLEYNPVYGADAYNPAFPYVGGTTYYRTYAGNVWKFISSSTQTGITPGTNSLIWELSSIGTYAHQRGTDTQVMSSGGIVITGDQILAWLASGGVFTPYSAVRTSDTSIAGAEFRLPYDCEAGNITVTMPTPANGRPLWFYNDGMVNNLIINSVEGSITETLTPGGRLALVGNGTAWRYP